MRKVGFIIAVVLLGACSSSAKTLNGPPATVIVTVPVAVIVTVVVTAKPAVSTTPATLAPTTTTTSATSAPTTAAPPTTKAGNAALGAPFTFGDYTITVSAPVPSDVKSVKGIDPDGSHLVTTHVKATYNGAKTGSAIEVEFDLKIVGSDHSIYPVSFKPEIKGALDESKDTITGGSLEGDAYFALPEGVTPAQIRLDPGFGDNVVTINLT